MKQLLEDYARIIDSTPEHVVKKNLWREEQHRANPTREPQSQKG